MSDTGACDLCGLPAGARPFVLDMPARRLQFCCEACRGIYQLLHDMGQAPAESGAQPPNPERKAP